MNTEEYGVFFQAAKLKGLIANKGQCQVGPVFALEFNLDRTLYVVTEPARVRDLVKLAYAHDREGQPSFHHVLLRMVTKRQYLTGDGVVIWRPLGVEQFAADRAKQPLDPNLITLEEWLRDSGYRYQEPVSIKRLTEAA